MRVVHSKDPYYTLVHDFYTDEELGYIWQELEYLNRRNVLTDDPAATSGAVQDKLFITLDAKPAQKQFLKSNYGKFLEDIYDGDRTKSPILTFGQKILVERGDYKQQMTGGVNPFNHYLFHINAYSTLLNYYEEKHYYAPHIDSSCMTAISYFWKEPRLFEGGELSFTDYPESRIDVRHNSLLIFPSFQKHAVSEVTLKDGIAPGQLNGRFSISQFLSHAFTPQQAHAPAR